MNDLQRPIRDEISEPSQIRSGSELIIALTQDRDQPWQQLNTINATLQNSGIEPFVEILDIPKDDLLEEDIPLSARRVHTTPLFYALAIKAFIEISASSEKCEIASCRNKFSKNLLQVLEKEVQSGDTTLIQWSAASAINSIWFDEECKRYDRNYGLYRSQLAIHNPRRIIQNILEQQRAPLNDRYNRLPRYSNLGTGDLSAKYKDYLDFWVYGPTQTLFNFPINSEDYRFLVERVLERLKVTGVQLGVESQNLGVIQQTLEFANTIFNSPDNQRQLTDLIKRFLNSDSAMPYGSQNVLFRHLTAQCLINLDKDSYESNWKSTIRARSAVILKDWEEVIQQFGESAVANLLEVAQGSLQLEEHSSLNLNRKVEAIQTIAKIQFADENKKLNTLCQFLQYSEPTLRDETACLLEPYQRKLNRKWNNLIRALQFQFSWQPPTNQSITITNIEQYIASAEQYQKEIHTIFSEAIQSCDANHMQAFFRNQLNNHLNTINRQVTNQIDTYFFNEIDPLEKQNQESEKLAKEYEQKGKQALQIALYSFIACVASPIIAIIVSFIINLLLIMFVIVFSISALFGGGGG